METRYMKTLTMILLVLPFVTACISGPSKGQLDDEVRRLCAMDGGIKVYEMVKLPAEKFDKYDQIRVPAKWLAKPEDEYYYESSTSYLIKGNPELRQDHYKIYRRSDQKLLGESVVYSRVGGDIPGPWHHSSFMCPEDSNLVRRVFIQSGEE
jgi:hypothetical protein